jgi:hypothetical protein
MRPEREAQVLRRLLGRNQGNLAPVVVARIWRELFPAMVLLQGPFDVVVSNTKNMTARWDLARSHFGSAAPMTMAKSPQRALAALKRIHRAGGGGVAILPVPSRRGAGEWWPQLLSEGVGVPRIVGKLPFVRTGEKLSPAAEAMVVGCLDWRPSGDDQTLVVIETRPQTPGPKVLSWMRAAKLPGQMVTAIVQEGQTGRRLHLIQISAYVETQDPRLQKVKALSKGAVARTAVIGGFPTCVVPKKLAKSSK